MQSVKMPVNYYHMLPAVINLWNLPAMIFAGFTLFAEELVGLPSWLGIPFLVASIAISMYWQFMKKRSDFLIQQEKLKREIIKTERYESGEIDEEDLDESV